LMCRPHGDRRSSPLQRRRGLAYRSWTKFREKRTSRMWQQSRFYVEAKGIKLHFLQYGESGPQVLLIPGITSPAITWGFVGGRLGRHARITILDNRGRGLSDQRPGLGHTTEDYAEDAAGVIEALGLAPSVVLGHSMGARVAARLAARRPDLVGRCILA